MKQRNRASLNSKEAADGPRGYLILLVDDEPCMRTLLGEFLERAGFRVVEAEDGEKAIEAAARDRPRLILMNYMMPVMDGLTASRIIHEDHELSHIPIIMVSACPEDEMRDVALQAGCVDYVQLPCSPLEILDKVMTHILVG